MIYDRAKFECGKWRATFTATTYAKAIPISTLYLAPMWSTVNGGLPLPALPFFRVVYMDTDGIPIHAITCIIQKMLNA